jgi:hypothetical protein
MPDEAKPVSGDWDKAVASSERSWNKDPGEHRNAPAPSIEEAMERTEEGYGSGKEGVDPSSDDSGTTPLEPAG